MYENSTREDRFRQALRKSLDSAKGPRRDDLYVISTALWVEKVRRELELATPYAVQQYFCPSAFHRKEGGIYYHDNKWPRYAIGKHRPVNELVEFVENTVPGAARILKHPLWMIIRNPTMSIWQKDRWIRELDGPVQKILLSRSFRQGPKSTRAQPVATIVQINSLQRLASLDALAALVFLLHEALKEKQLGLALKIGDRIFQVLMITFIFPPLDYFVDEIIDCFQRRVFSLVQCEGVAIDATSVDCRLLARLLEMVVIQRARNTPCFVCDEKNLVRVSCDLLHPRRPDVMFALASPHVIVDSCVSPRDKEMIVVRNRYREWGIEKILGRRSEKFPP